MGADLRLVNHRTLRGRAGGRHRSASGAAARHRVPERLVPLAIDEFPAFFIAAACAEGETRRDRRRGTARQGERPDRGDGRGPRRRSACATRCCRTACASRAARSAAARSTAAAITGSRCRSPWRACVRAAPIEILRRGQRRDVVPGLRRARALGGHRDRGARLRCRRACPSRSSPSTGRAARARAPSRGWSPRRLGWHLLDSGALYRLVALAGASARPRPRTTSRRTRPWPPASTSASRSTPRAASAILLDGRTSRANCGPRRPAPRPRGSPRCRPCARRCCGRQRAFAEPPGLVADGRDMGTVVFPTAAAQGLPDGQRRGTRAAGAISS